MKYLKIVFIFLGLLSLLVLNGCGAGNVSGAGAVAGSGNTSANFENATVTLDSSFGGIADGSINVSLSPIAALRFGAKMNPVTVSDETIFISTSDSKDGAIPIGNLSSNKVNTLFSFNPEALLLAHTKYFIIVNGAKTISGTSVNAVFSFTTGAFITPTASIISPSNGAAGVSTTPSIQFKFSADVFNVTSDNVTLHEGSVNGISIALHSIVSGTDNIYTASVSQELKKRTVYCVLLSSGIIDTNSNPLEQTSSCFTTGDLSIPVVNIISPSNNSAYISTTPGIQLHFSKPVNNVGTNITLHENSIDGPVVKLGQILESPDSDMVTFSPGINLKDNTSYFIIVGSGIIDSFGNKVVPAIFNFTTGDFTAPVVNLLSPSNNTTDVTRIPNIILHFSEAVNNVNAANVTLYSDNITSPTVPLKLITFDSVNNTATFSPVGILNGQTTYYVGFTGITDLGGNALAPASLRFNTVATQLKCWGDGGFGQLKIPPTLSNPISVSSGGHNVCAINSAGLQCWGLNSNGQNNVPALVNPISVAAGGHHTCALDSRVDGNHVMCWGRNNLGQTNVPPLVNPTSISAGGDNNACAIDSRADGNHVICWGSNANGQLNIPALTNPTHVSVGDTHICALDSTRVHCWGSSLVVPLLVNPTIVSTEYNFNCVLDSTGVKCWNGAPTVPALVNPTGVSVGYQHACAIDKTGVHCWGSNTNGQLNVPSLLNPTDISAGRYHSCAIVDSM